ncbi:amidohydrolase family protein [Kitasatospora aburaviensis]
MSRLLITHAHLLHPEDGTRTEPAWLEAADGRIAATGTGRPPAAGEDVRVIDARGATVLPGLIDAHVHLLVTSLDLRDVADWTPATRPSAPSPKPGACCAGASPPSGTSGADHGMARALAEGLAPGPRLVHGGKALSQTGGHGDLRPLGDDALPCCEARPHFGRIADGVDAVRAAARDEFRKGAAHLKVLLSGGVASPNDEIAAVQYSEEEIRAAVEEAENHNRYVTVHAYHPRAIDRALRAGVRCVEHGNLLDDASAALLRERDAFLVPTLVAYEQTAKLGAASGLPPAALGKLAEVRDQGLAALERAHRAGVNLVYGSDLLGPLHPAQLEEFRLRAEVQPAADVIRSATVTAARLLGMAGRSGPSPRAPTRTCWWSTATRWRTSPCSPGRSATCAR